MAITDGTAHVRADPSFERLFQASPAPCLVLKPDAPHFTIFEVNDAYLAATMRAREDVVGRGIFEAFPDNPDDPTVAGVRTLQASLEHVLATRQPDTLPGLKYDITRPDGRFEERWWSPVNSPVLDESGEVEFIIHNANDVTEQHRAEASLRESESRLAAAFESVPAGVAVINLAGEVVLANGECRRFLPDGIIPSHDLERGYRWQAWDDRGRVIAPDDYPGARASRGASVIPGQEMLYTGDDGRAVWTNVAAAPTFNVVGQVTGSVSVISDITGRKANEVRLATELRHTTLLRDLAARLVTEESGSAIYAEILSAAVAIMESDAGTVQVYDPKTRSLVLLVTQGIPKRMTDHFYRVDAGSNTACGIALKTGQRTFVDFDKSETDEACRMHVEAGYCSAQATPLLSREGAPIGMINTHWRASGHRSSEEQLRFLDLLARQAADLIEHRHAEDDLRESEARYRLLNASLEQRVADAVAEKRLMADIIDKTDVFVQVADMDYRWLAINKAAANEFERIFGSRPKVGDSMLDLLAARPDQQAAVRAVWARALEGEEFTDVQEFGDEAREQRFYEMKFNSLHDPDGKRIGAYQFVYDVTDRLREQARLKEAEEALRQSQKLEAMGKLTGGVSHDFNNLLTPIVGALDLLKRKNVGGEREQRLIGGALQSAERARVLVQRLLAFARRQPLQSRAVDIGALVSGMADLIVSTSGPQVKVVVDVADGLPAAVADPNQIEMAILNLAVNARDAMTSGGTVTISVEGDAVNAGHRSRLQPGHYIRLSVADTGSGMDEATIARAIEPFFSTKGIGRGTGLGLSMVHGLASQLGGALAIESQLGRGTNVEVWLPASDKAASPSERTEDIEARPTAGIVLLVDDEDLVRASTADMLTELGFTVVEAGSAEEALRLVDGGQPLDVLITDHLMPGMTGIELARKLRGDRANVRVLVMSGYADVDGVAHDLPRLVKPFRKIDLAAKLGDLDKVQMAERQAAT